MAIVESLQVTTLIWSIELDNARIFEGKGWSFPLAPLTVLCGTNSAGKSTLLKILLLLRQSLGATEPIGPTKSRLRFSGSQIDLGDYNSFISHHESYRDLLIGVGLDAVMPTSLAAQLRDSGAQLQPEPGAGQEDEEFEVYQLSCKFTFGIMYAYERPQEKTTKDRATDDADEGTDPARQPLLKNADFQISLDGHPALNWQVSVSSIDEKGERRFQIRLPRKYVLGPSGLTSMQVVEAGDHVQIPTFLRGLLPDRLIGRVNGTGSPPEDDFRVWPLPQHLEMAQRDLRRALSNIQYLGPLRSPAKRFYTSQMDADPIMDPAGEFLPDLLRERAESRVWNLHPGQSETRRETLAEALDFWLYYLRTGKSDVEEREYDRELSIQTIQRVLIQLAVRTVSGSESYPLADSGFGYSQVLPILARGLMTNPGSTLIVEQPEVHLNPALQVRVADFLVAMARARKQILVETHSEHIVNSIRAASAEDESGETSSLCRILYLESSGEKPSVHELSVTQDGNVPEWPRNFFGEASNLAGRLLRAQRRSRQKSGVS